MGKTTYSVKAAFKMLYKIYIPGFTQALVSSQKKCAIKLISKEIAKETKMKNEGHIMQVHQREVKVEGYH